MRSKPTARIGIYAGTFNPVHTGHITFALQAKDQAALDKVYFLPERRPRHKKGVEHFGHRVAMLKQALRPHPSFHVLELDDVSFSTVRTLPKLRRLFSNSEIVFLFGSDVVDNLSEWPRVERLLEHELVIGCRDGVKSAGIIATMEEWVIRPKGRTIIKSHAAEVSSARVRSALRRRQPARGVLTSVKRYSNRNWLYVSLA